MVSILAYERQDVCRVHTTMLLVVHAYLSLRATGCIRAMVSESILSACVRLRVDNIPEGKHRYRDPPLPLSSPL